LTGAGKLFRSVDDDFKDLGYFDDGGGFDDDEDF